jgi:hypothetical protein
MTTSARQALAVLSKALEHIEGAALDITVDRHAIAKAARAALTEASAPATDKDSLAVARDTIRGHEATIERLQSSLVKANQAFELGRQQGMEQERALWRLAAESEQLRLE